MSKDGLFYLTLAWDKWWNRTNEPICLVSSLPMSCQEWLKSPQYIMFTILNKITGPWNVGHSNLPVFIRSSKFKLNILFLKNDENPWKSVQDIMQYQWTMKCRSHWLRRIMTSTAMWNWSFMSGLIKKLYWKMFLDIIQNQWTIKYRSQWPTNIGHNDLQVFWGHMPC